MTIYAFHSYMLTYAFFCFRFQSFRYGIHKRSISDASLHTYTYLERGHPSNEKPSLLLVHGFSASKYNFLSFISFLPRDHHVIAVDLPGHGETPVKDEELCIMLFVRAVHEVKEKCLEYAVKGIEIVYFRSCLI